METELNLKNAYETACKIACDELKKRNPADISLNTNSLYDSDSNTLLLNYLNDTYRIDCTTGNISIEGRNCDITSTTRVLLLHYLINSRIKPFSGNMVSFREIPGGGSIYYQTFSKRAIEPLVKTFGKNIDAFHCAAAGMNCIPERYGNASVTMKVLPLVPVTYVIWQGDEELPDTGTILFDDSVTNFLPVEDIVFAASFGAYALISRAKG